jgi:hypothetical protein
LVVVSGATVPDAPLLGDVFATGGLPLPDVVATGGVPCGMVTSVTITGVVSDELLPVLGG